MRRFASWTARLSRLATGQPAGAPLISSERTSSARALATSPALWPPRPSATAKTSPSSHGQQPTASSFPSRTQPMSVRWKKSISGITAREQRPSPSRTGRGGVASELLLDIEVQRELVRMRAQPDRVDLFLSLVFEPGLDHVV